MYEFCQLSCGGSVASAVKLNKQAAETVAMLTEEREALPGQVILTRDWSTYPQY